MPTIFLVRHGETDWNRSGQIMGEQPVPLNQQGLTQAHRLAGLLQGRPIRAIYSSPVARARQTADILASTVDAPVTLNQGLTEIGVGQWEGLYWNDVAEEIIRHDFYRKPDQARPPGGETLREVQARAVSVVERACALPSDGPLLFVSHADVLRTILAHYLRLELATIRQIRISHASLTAIEITGHLADLVCLNYPPDLSIR
ncbi:MAG: histidine phosphatase family protein [Nitrospirota bacterium]|nr:histidine phosphatase family protein [Nitrospirota bacterium]MDE3243454.1 histidine phosphatase family protein [Nitrospirota bacterium]